jgi:subtilisin family serine protease
MRVFSRGKCLWIAAAVVALAAAGFLWRPAPAGAQALKTYLLTTSGPWGAAQDSAIAAAGGTVTFSHVQTGIGAAVSGQPNFIKQALASGAFDRGAEDILVQWQPPVRQGGVIEAAVTPGDETFINLQWNLTAVEAPGAWAAGITGAGVRIAVLDGGIWDQHIDLNGQIDVTASRSFVPGHAFNEDAAKDAQGNEIFDTFWHGTHVAGIIAAKDNGIGTIGIAPGATIIGVKVLHCGSGYFSWIIEGLLYASTPAAEGGAGADIINMSLGALFRRTASGPLVGALNKAVNYAGERALVVCAAGNDGVDLDHAFNYTFVPAESGSAIAISATGPYGFAVGWPYGATDFRRVASYTNYGNSLVWLAAPGGDFALPGSALCTIPRAVSGTVASYCWVFDMVMSTVRGQPASTTTYSWSAGTSMAAPAVAAVAALVKERFPAFTVGDIKTWLVKTADDEGKTGHDPYYGRGFVNARRAATEY